MKKYLPVIIAIIVVFLIFNVWTKPKTIHDEVEAFTIAEEIVLGELNAPSTAKFCRITEATITCTEDLCTVKGWVEAQNLFGGTVRKIFYVSYTPLINGRDVGYRNPICTFY